MTEPLTTTISQSFIIGMIMGICHGINKKIVAIIWILALLFLIGCFIISPNNTINELGNNWNILNWITMIVSVNVFYLIGWAGITFVKETLFKKKGGKK